MGGVGIHPPRRSWQLTDLDPRAPLAGRHDVEAAHRLPEERVLRVPGLVAAADLRDGLAERAGDVDRVGPAVVEGLAARALEAERVGAGEEDRVLDAHHTYIHVRTRRGEGWGYRSLRGGAERGGATHTHNLV